MKNKLITTIAFIMLFCISDVSAQCPTENSIYSDLDNWVHANAGPGRRNGLIAQVTLINQAPDGRQFYTGYGVSCFSLVASSNGQCDLSTNPWLNFVFSDRYVGGQPFDIARRVSKRVKLDIVNNQVTIEGGPNSLVTYTNVNRVGNIIYATRSGSILIINIRKVVQGQILDCGYPN